MAGEFNLMPAEPSAGLRADMRTSGRGGLLDSSGLGLEGPGRAGRYAGRDPLRPGAFDQALRELRPRRLEPPRRPLARRQAEPEQASSTVRYARHGAATYFRFPVFS